MKNKRPSFRGTGIWMHQQFRKETLVKGDTCWDADFGHLKWNGEEWKSYEPRKKVKRKGELESSRATGYDVSVENRKTHVQRTSVRKAKGKV